MDWNTYLYDIIESYKKKEHTFYYILNEDEHVTEVRCSDIYKNMVRYENILKNYSSMICVVYHKFDAEFIGFIIAAFKVHVKVLIRRTSLNDYDSITEDLLFLRDILPINLLYTSRELTEKFNNNKIIAVDSDVTLYDTTNYEYDKIQNTEYDFIQLSSGTTSTSKAFCLNVEGIIKSALHIKNVHHLNNTSLFLSYLTLTHIYGFVSGFILPIVSESCGFFCSTTAIKNNPSLLFDVITAEKVTHCSVIINTIEQALKSGNKDWNLSTLKCVSLGGEKVDYLIYERIKSELKKYGMNPNALVNSYGMSEKGSITMEDPNIGNTIYISENNGVVSVGNSHYEDTNVVIFDDSKKIMPDGCIGMVGIESMYLAKFCFCHKNICNLKKSEINGHEYYHNGDCGFIIDNKLYITGRKINTLTYNGLKMESDVLNEYIREYFLVHNIFVKRCFCFNYPLKNNSIICFVDYDSVISGELLKKLDNKILIKYHIQIDDYYISTYEGHGINKISLPEIIRQYNEQKNSGK